MVETYHASFVIFGLAIFSAVVLPRLLAHRPMSLPIIYVAGGFVRFAIPHDVTASPVMDAFERWEQRTRPARQAQADGAGESVEDPENGQ